MNNQMNQGGPNSKFKTMLCRHFDTPKGCMHKDKCQFAHGLDDLRSSQGGSNVFIYYIIIQNNFDFNSNSMSNNNNNNNMQNMNKKKTPNPQNYKIVKCVNFENCTLQYSIKIR